MEILMLERPPDFPEPASMLYKKALALVLHSVAMARLAGKLLGEKAAEPHDKSIEGLAMGVYMLCDADDYKDAMDEMAQDLGLDDRWAMQRAAKDTLIMITARALQREGKEHDALRVKARLLMEARGW